jgi:hypothetical protein
VKPTSKTTAQIFIIFTFKSPGFQAATIIISALVVNLSKRLVLLLHAITVAQAFTKSEIIGFPTILLLPITHTIFHSTFISSAFKISITPAGVQGIKALLSQIRTFQTLFGWKPSTSFFG